MESSAKMTRTTSECLHRPGLPFSRLVPMSDYMMTCIASTSAICRLAFGILLFFSSSSIVFHHTICLDGETLF